MGPSLGSGRPQEAPESSRGSDFGGSTFQLHHGPMGSLRQLSTPPPRPNPSLVGNVLAVHPLEPWLLRPREGLSGSRETKIRGSTFQLHHGPVGGLRRLSTPPPRPKTNPSLAINALAVHPLEPRLLRPREGLPGSRGTKIRSSTIKLHDRICGGLSSPPGSDTKVPCRPRPRCG